MISAQPVGWNLVVDKDVEAKDRVMQRAVDLERKKGRGELIVAFGSPWPVSLTDVNGYSEGGEGVKTGRVDRMERR